MSHYTENHILDLFSCLLCQDVFHLNISAVLHLQDAHNQPVTSSFHYISRPEWNKTYLCLICQQRFFNRSVIDLANHFLQEHGKELNPDEVRFSCRLCLSNNLFFDELSLTQHEACCRLESLSSTEPDEGRVSSRMKWGCGRCGARNSILEKVCCVCTNTRLCFN